MKPRTLISVVAVLFAALTLPPSSEAQTNAPRITSAVWTNGAFSLAWTNSGTNAVTIERRPSLTTGSWTAIGSNNVSGAHSDTDTPVGSAFYRLRIVTGSDAPPNMALIPAGSFSIGNQMDSNEGFRDELPVHTVHVREFYIDRFEVTVALWNEVANWAATNGYDVRAANASGKAANHPAYNVNWYETVKWSNARSQKEGLTPCYTVAGQ
jgi:formylglycine-generating enzyme required for sulfatase activity